MSYKKENELNEKADALSHYEEDIKELTKKFGLEPYETKNWVVDYNDITDLVAYGGFQERYPHWRWGMKHDMAYKKSRFLNSAPYEMVINSDPSHAYLQESNSQVVQKLVMAHVEGHSDFFAKNKWFKLLTEAESAVETLSENARKIRSYMEDPDIEREEVEKWIDSILSVEFNINQYHPEKYVEDVVENVDKDEKDMKEVLREKGFSEEIIDEVFDSNSYKEEKKEVSKGVPAEPEEDILKFLSEHGRYYDEKEDQSFEMEHWQKDVLNMLRKESMYFAPQAMTKIMNEGWAAYWHTKVMAGESFADDSEFVEYAKTQSKVLGGGGPTNPYKLGKELWEYVENKNNREEVYKHILKVEGVTPENVLEQIDMSEVVETVRDEEVVYLNSDSFENLLEKEEFLDRENSEIYKKLLEMEEDASRNELSSEKLDKFIEEKGIEVPENYLGNRGNNPGAEEVREIRKEFIDLDEEPWKLLNHEGLASRHYSLNTKKGIDFLKNIKNEDIKKIARVYGSEDLYDNLEEALDNVDKKAGWNRMFEVREDFNDARFIDSYLTQEFVDQNNYFAYENVSDGQTSMPLATSSKAEDVKKKLLLKTVNMGKPRIRVKDGNHRNEGGLLLEHDYNGVELDIPKAKETLNFLHKMWGKYVHLKTIIKKRDEEYQQKMSKVLRKASMMAQMGQSPDKLEIPKPKEEGALFTYDGSVVRTKKLGWEEVEHLSADSVDYDTLPEEWKV